MTTRLPYSAFRIPHSAFCVALSLAATAGGVCSGATAQPLSRGYERTFRYPHPVPPVIETMAEVEWRERTLGVPEPAPGPGRTTHHPVEAPLATPAPLLPGARQSEIVVPASGALPVLPLAPPTPIDPLPATPPADRMFDGPGYAGYRTPDGAIAASPTYVVSAVNRRIEVRTLSGTLLSSVSFASFFPNEPTRAGLNPRLVYDKTTGRFLFVARGTQFGSSPVSNCMLAVSATSDPTGVWYKYVLDVGRGGSPPAEWASDPSLGVDSTAIFVAFGTVSFSQNAYTGNRLLVIDKNQALAGQALTTVQFIDNIALPTPTFAAGALDYIIKPVESAEPGTASLLIGAASLYGLNLIKITDPLGAQGTPVVTRTFIDTTDIQTAGAAAQAGTTTTVSVGDRRLEKAVYAGGFIWTCQVASSTNTRGGKPKVILYKVRPTGNGTLVDSKSLVDATRAYYCPAIVPTGSGDAILIFTTSDVSSFPSMGVARYNGATSQLESPVLVEPGRSPWLAGGWPWGAYQDGALDVVTGTHVWVQGIIPIASELWQMRIARFPASAPAAPGELTVNDLANAQVSLQWKDNSVGETGFKIERKAGNAAFARIATVGEDATRFTDTSVSPGTSYTYRVRSFNGVGDSAPTGEATATPTERAVGIASVVLAPNPAPAGGTAVGIVVLDGPAPAAALTVALATSNAAVAGLAASSLLVPQGAVSASFVVNTASLSVPGSVSITATANGTSKSAVLNVRP